MKFIIVLLLCTAVYARKSMFFPFGDIPQYPINELIPPNEYIPRDSSETIRTLNYDENSDDEGANPKLIRLPFSSSWASVLTSALKHAEDLKKLLLEGAFTARSVESNVSDEPVDREVSYDDFRNTVTGDSELNKLVEQLEEILLEAWNLWNSEKRSEIEWYSPQREVSEGRRSFLDKLTEAMKRLPEWLELGKKIGDLAKQAKETWTKGKPGRRMPAAVLPIASFIATLVTAVVDLVNKNKDRILRHLLNQIY